MTTFGRGGTKQEKIKRANEAKAAARLEKVMSKGNELTGIDKIRYDLSTLERSLLAVEYDKKHSIYGSMIDEKIKNIKQSITDKEKELQKAIAEEEAQIFICWECHREFNNKEDRDEHECVGGD